MVIPPSTGNCKPIARWVHLIFRKETVAEFWKIFYVHQEAIRHFPGCLHLAVWVDMHNPLHVYTYSLWENLDALEAYRKSELFQLVWGKVKPLFGAPALARTLYAPENTPVP
ncbi:MAG: putative quinol monooxygenase [Bacteroidia bacterium]